MLKEAIHIAKAGRSAIFEKMAESIVEPKPLSPHAPRIVSVKIPADRIGELIGPSGKNIKGIQAESGAEINIEDDGTVHIHASKQEGLDRAWLREQKAAEAEACSLMPLSNPRLRFFHNHPSTAFLARAATCVFIL